MSVVLLYTLVNLHNLVVNILYILHKERKGTTLFLDNYCRKRVCLLPHDSLVIRRLAQQIGNPGLIPTSALACSGSHLLFPQQHTLCHRLLDNVIMRHQQQLSLKLHHCTGKQNQDYLGHRWKECDFKFKQVKTSGYIQAMSRSLSFQFLYLRLLFILFKTI